MDRKKIPINHFHPEKMQIKDLFGHLRAMYSVPFNNIRTHKKSIAAIFVFILISMASIAACNVKDLQESDKPETQKKKEDPGIHKSFDRGPVSVLIDVDKQEINIAEQLQLSITVISDEDYDVELPGFGEKLEQFGIVDYHTSQPSLTEKNRSKITRSYVLEPFLSGDYTIPPMTVQFHKKDKPDGTLHEIETEAIKVSVTSLLPENFEELTLHDIKPPENMPQSYVLWFWCGGIFLVVLFAGTAGWVLYRKKKHSGSPMVPIIPAHRLAMADLQSLVAEKLVEQGMVKQFYQKISNILRKYIENRFHIHAPEQTTEEFLSGIQARDDFENTHKILLKNFLTHCDLVKFAKHQPETDDIQKTFDACKVFIVETQEKD